MKRRAGLSRSGQWLWSRSLVSCAGLLGACGIGLGAAGAHAGGGTLAGLAATFLLVHAAAVIGMAAWAGTSPRFGKWMLVAASLLVIGVAAFSADLACLAFLQARPVRGLAPAGGLMMIAGWLTAAAAPWLGRTSTDIV